MGKQFTEEEARDIGNQLNVNWNNINFDEFFRGLHVELEHGAIDERTNVTDNDPLATGRIALAHLYEFPDYYTRLEKLEKEAEEYWLNKKV